jgi:hypothetical protein
MYESNSIWRFVVLALAIWRITHLLAEEDGPWDLIVRLRSRLGSGVLGRLMDCFYCLSLWVSLPLALLLSRDWIALLIQWQALSGAVCLLEKVTLREEPAHPASLARTELSEGDRSCAVVKSEAS